MKAKATAYSLVLPVSACDPLRVIEVKSTRPTALDYTVNTRDTFREPRGIKPFTHTAEKIFLGEAHMRHAVPDTPGPGRYQPRVSMGKQVLTKNRWQAHLRQSMSSAARMHMYIYAHTVCTTAPPNLAACCVRVGQHRLPRPGTPHCTCHACGLVVLFRTCRLPPLASSCRAWFSHDRAPIAFSFSTSDRFGYVERALKKNATPGPGSYVA
jgi:hypothetical protein